MANRNQRRHEQKVNLGIDFLRESFLNFLTLASEQIGISRARVEELARGADPIPHELERLGECMIFMTHLALYEEYNSSS